jgi:ABC-type transport system involved in multi-copper enzyme maturation permease subunit
MTHILAIARREIEERALVFVAAIAFALIPLVLLVIPTGHGAFAERKSGVVILGFFLGVAFIWALALILGATMVGRELSEKRLSFYFTRPISGSAVWFGKLLAALALLAVSFAILNVIPLVLGSREWQSMSTVTRQFAVFRILAMAVLLMFGGHVVSTWIRSRSPIVALDFVAFLVVAGVLVATAEPLVLMSAFGPLSNVTAVAIAAFLVAVIGGGARQLSRGRIEVRRNHRELSIFVWSVAFVAAVVTFAYGRWVVAATPRDFTSVQGMQRGGVVEVHGSARGFYPEFVVNPATGAFVRGGTLFAEAGDVVAVLAPSSTFENAKIAFLRGQLPSDWMLTVTRLANPAEQIAALPMSGHVRALGISADGSRAAVLADEILTVYDTRSRHALASVRVGRVASAAQMKFVAPGTVRTFFPEEGTRVLRVHDFNVGTRQWTNVAGPLQLKSLFLYRVVGPLLLTRSQEQVEVRDLRNPGAVQTAPADASHGIWFLRDGRQAIYRYGRPASVAIRRNGAQERLVQFPPDVESVRVAGELADGRLLVSTYTHSRNELESTTYFLDPRTGALEHPMAHVFASLGWPTAIGISDPAVKYGALLHRDSGKIDAVDLQTGAVRTLN